MLDDAESYLQLLGHELEAFSAVKKTLHELVAFSALKRLFQVLVHLVLILKLLVLLDVAAVRDALVDEGVLGWSEVLLEVLDNHLLKG